MRDSASSPPAEQAHHIRRSRAGSQEERTHSRHPPWEIGEWRERLKQVGQWINRRAISGFFRGLRNEAAIRARCDGMILLPPLGPICFSYKRESALGFAGQENCDGALISVDVPFNSVVFADVDGRYRDGNAHEEAEVVLVLPESVVASD
jgi:hypothetical protein